MIMAQVTPVPNAVHGEVHRLKHVIEIGIHAGTQGHHQDAQPGVKSVCRFLPENSGWAAPLLTAHSAKNAASSGR